MRSKSRIWPFVVALLLAAHFVHGESLPFERLDDLRGPYDGTGAAGDAFYMFPLGTAGAWPIRAYWSSARTERSPLLGFGWCIPALESKFVQFDERRWVFHQPDGFARVFVRTARESGDVLSGGTAWKATVRGDTIKVVADPHDGGPKSEFTFSHGRLIRMVCEEGEFDIGYSGRVAERISSRGKVLLEVVRKPEAENRITFRFNNGKFQTVAELRPAPVFRAGASDTGGSYVQESRLAAFTDVGGRPIARFEYGGTAEEAFFKANDEIWRWDPRSRRITNHGGWSYSVFEPKNEWDEPAISRSRDDGRQERHHYDRKSGLCVQQLADGTLRECKMFTSGPLAWRRARWMKDTKPDGSCVRTDFAYDEAGRVFYRRTTRESDDSAKGSKEELWFDAKGATIRRRLNDEEAPVE